MLINILKLPLFFLIVGATDNSCPPRFDLVRNGECRGIETNYNGYNNDMAGDAIKACGWIEGQPVSIHIEEDQVYWEGISQHLLTDENLILGLICNPDSRRYQWADGSTVDYKPANDKYDESLDEYCTKEDGCTWYMNYTGHWINVCGTDWTEQAVYCIKKLQQPVDDCEDVADDFCYQIGTTAESWQEAQRTCASFGANLASVHSANENSFIRRLAVSQGKVDSVFLGGTVSGKGKDFGWADGSKWDYNNFYPGFPIEGLGDCLAMETDGTSGQWVNTDCNSKMPVACKRDKNYNESLTCSSGPFKEGDVITSPGFPFDASTPCDFILQVEAGKIVQVEIQLLQANSCCDFLVLHENYIGGTIIANLTGEIQDGVYTTASSNFMRVSWQPQGGINVVGVMMTYRGVS